jgi:hypothetical protein
VLKCDKAINFFQDVISNFILCRYTTAPIPAHLLHALQHLHIPVPAEGGESEQNQGGESEPTPGRRK